MTKLSLRQAIRAALNQRNLTAAAIPVLLGVSQLAGAQTAGNAPADQKSQSLETIVVTGSNIRRVDIETANPVITIDRATIQQSGKATLGDLVQSLPAISGNAMNPQVNNGGGGSVGGTGGVSGASLRGLGSVRTLVLLNGHRMTSTNGVADLNAIPVNVVERIEVLSDGASAVYGSDAIGGVVNIITRTSYQGVELSTGYGITDRDDGQRKEVNFTFGQTTDKGSVIGGVNYNKLNAIAAGNRAFSAFARYLSSGVGPPSGGSSRAISGRIFLPDALVSSIGGAACLDGTDSLTLKAGAVGTSPGDYRCFANSDKFNFQGVGNYDQTPSERTGLFFLGNYKLTDNVEAYAEFFYNRTVNQSQFAPVPFDEAADGVPISKDSYYNPFGVDCGPPNFDCVVDLRLVALGNRQSNFRVDASQINTGLKGSFGDSDWTWNANFTYGHNLTDAIEANYISYKSILADLGPSYKDATGAIVCGTDPAKGGTGPIAGCTPLNLLNQHDPNTIAILHSVGANPFVDNRYITRQEDVNVNGAVWTLPAGPVQLAAGLLHRTEYYAQAVSSTIVTQPDGTCDLPQSLCTSPTEGSFNVREAYAELLIPLLKDMPFANALNLDLGDRYSKYSDFGSTNNWKVSLEYRPIEDLLLRGTVSKVFRAPTLSNLFKGPAGSSPVVTDPCQNLSAAQLAQHAKGCAHVPVNYVQLFGQATALTEGAQIAGVSLEPEHGKSFDFGFVYDPHWIPGLSFNADMYRIALQNLIISAPTNAVAQVVLNSCFANDASILCNLIHRVPQGAIAGTLNLIQQPTLNLGRLDTKGVDFGASYRIPETPIGNFTANFKATYIGEYNNDQSPGQPGDFVAHVAGHYSNVYGNFSRWRALAGLNWNLGPWNAMWTVRYIGGFTQGYANPNLGPSADGAGYVETGCAVCTPVLKYGATVYNNVSVGYNIEPLNTRIDVGVDNLGDRSPPIQYLNNTTNGNVDTYTFDTAGRFYFARVTVKF